MEFSTKEAIVILSELDGSAASRQPAAVALALNYLRQAQQTATPPTDPPSEEFQNTAADDLEEGELERRAAAANEWRRRRENSSGLAAAAAAAAHASLCVSAWNNAPASGYPTDLIDGLDSVTLRQSADGSDASRLTDSDSIQAGQGAFSVATSESSMTRLPSSETDAATIMQQQQQQQQQRVVPPTFAAAVHDETTFCTNCRQLLEQLDQQIEQKAYLKRDLSSLASALSEEEQVRFNVQQVKESLEEDIQHVTSLLFKTLNCILMDDVTDHEDLVRLDRELGGNKLQGILRAWDIREERLKEIKELLVDLDAAAQQSACATERLGRFRQDDHDAPAILPRLSTNRQSALRFSSPPSPLVPLSEDESSSQHSQPKKTIRIDGLVFDEFQQHIKALGASPNNPMPSTAFMKRVMAEDIDPCLFQNAGSSWWKSPWFKRKLIDNIASNRCEIQSYPSTNNNDATISSSSPLSSPTTSLISSSSAPSTPTTATTHTQQPSAPRTKCTCCGYLRICEFRMRLQGSPQQHSNKVPPWLPIDRFCRDRIVAVCDFYSFMSHLRQGLMQHTPVLQMFKQCMHYRRKMGLAKVGSIGLFSDDDGRGKSYSQQLSHRRSRSSWKRESAATAISVLDLSGSGSDSGSAVSISDNMQGINYTGGQIIIVH